MVLIAEFSFPGESFALRETLPQFPDVVVEAGRLVAHSPETTMPCLWVAGESLSAFDEALRADPTVADVTATVEFQEEWFYHLTWTDEVEALVAEMVDHEGAILQATGTDDRWRARMRFATRDQFESFRDHFEEHEANLRLEQLFEQEFPHQRGGDVTPEQYRALTTAYRAGYFGVPRAASIEDVADELGVSHQAVSERLRRGTANLVRELLLHQPDGES